VIIRAASEADLDSIVAIQANSPGAAPWKASDYLRFDCRVAEEAGRIIGFLVTRRAAPGESEILNLAVHPSCRRRGIARALLYDVLGLAGEWFLEVRESNLAAIELYQSLGFKAVGRRPAYYTEPLESGIVMKFRS
jgi:ribosomal-protein-alanine N-acetyltransferase